MVLFGLVDYLAASQELNANFDVDVLLNGSSIGKRHFTAADAASGVDFPVDVAAGQLHPGSNQVQITKPAAGAPTGRCRASTTRPSRNFTSRALSP